LLYLFFFKSINREFKASLKSPLIWFFSIIGFLALFVQTMSLKYTTASNSAFITAAFIIFIPIIKRYVYKTNIKVGFYLAVLLAYFFIGEIMTLTKLIGCCVVFAALFIGSFFR